MLPLKAPVTHQSSLLPTRAPCYPQKPLLPTRAPCYPLKPLSPPVTHQSPCYPPEPLVTLLSLCHPPDPLLPAIISCYSYPSVILTQIEHTSESTTYPLLLSISIVLKDSDRFLASYTITSLLRPYKDNQLVLVIVVNAIQSLS